MKSVILVAGGLGKRMETEVPKQYLRLGDQCVASYSFDLFCGMDEIDEIIVVCHDEYRHFFQHKKAIFALPGERRQDSVFNGLQKATGELICIHDAARPYITAKLVRQALQAANEVGAAALGVPLKFTIKEKDPSDIVVRTPDRENFWEIQTPHVIRRDLLWEGFEWARNRGINVTDDVSLVELINHPVKLIHGSHINLKITTIEDMVLAEALLPQYLKENDAVQI